MSINNQLPDFIVIGASKSGTTSLYQYLREHDEIFMPIKEINYFAYSEDIKGRLILGNYLVKKFHAKTLEEYKSLFSKIGREKVCGEASPIYLSSPLAAENIKSVIPEVKLIVSLRNPVERALSEYLMHVRLGNEKRGPQEAFADLAKEPYVLAGQYYMLLRRYYEQFDSAQIHIQLFEEFRENPVGKIKDIYKFVGVNEDFEPNTSKIYKKGGMARNAMARVTEKAMNAISESKGGKMVRKLLPAKIKQKARQSIESYIFYYPEIDEDIKERLREFYIKDNEKLGQFTGIDLSVWS